MKLAIKDEKGPFKPLRQVNQGDFRDIFKGALKQRLIKLEVPNYEDIIVNLLKILKENQSIITMGV